MHLLRDRQECLVDHLEWDLEDLLEWDLEDHLAWDLEDRQEWDLEDRLEWDPEGHREWKVNKSLVHMVIKTTSKIMMELTQCKKRISKRIRINKITSKKSYQSTLIRDPDNSIRI